MLHGLETDVEYKLLSKIMSRNDMTVLIDRQITPDMFYDERAREAYRFVYDHRKKYDELPSLDLFETEHPDIRLGHAPEAVGYYVDKLLENYVRMEASDAILAHADKIMRDPLDGLESARDALAHIDLRVNPTEDIDMQTNAAVDDAIAEYEELENMEGLSGYAFPWDTLNEGTRGLHEGELLSVVARPNVGKTMLAVKIASYFQEQGLNVLINTREMPAKQMRRRWMGAHFRLPYKELRSGLLPEGHKKRMIQGLKDYAKNKLSSVIHGKDRTHGKLYITECATVEQLRSKVKRLKPDVWVADGAYLFRNKQKDQWAIVTENSRELKQLCLDLKVPGVATWQFGRGSDSKKMEGGLEDIGMSDAIGQDADVVLALFANKDLELNRERLVRVIKARESEKTEFKVGWDLSDGPTCQLYQEIAMPNEISFTDAEDEDDLDF